MKKLWIQPQGEYRYLVGAAKVRKTVGARDKREALQKAKALLTPGERAAIREASTRSERTHS